MHPHFNNNKHCSGDEARDAVEKSELLAKIDSVNVRTNKHTEDSNTDGKEEKSSAQKSKEEETVSVEEQERELIRLDSCLLFLSVSVTRQFSFFQNLV